MLSKINLLFNTIKHLKLSQIYWQIIYRIKKKTTLTKTNILLEISPIHFQYYPEQKDKYFGDGHFRFLNLEKNFEDHINWSYDAYGKLWSYNLEYFDYLQQEDIEVETKVNLLKNFYDFSITQSKVLEPYPVSLRIINSIKFLSRHEIKDTYLFNCLYQEAQFLSENLEYHILGNHLLENGFALLLAGAYFDERLWVKKGEEILNKELNEQIHQDGAHFELSPMYHQIILFRVLELIDWYRQWDGKKDDFLTFIEKKASEMLAFLDNISFLNGDIPHFNDSANGIAYSTIELKQYAKDLAINKADLTLDDSGYRTFSNESYEIKIDVAQLAVNYQPGHAHADSLGYIIYANNKPFVIEQGTSTYQINERRALERSSKAHNTVTIQGKNHSKVWSGFRVAQRAVTTILEEGINYIKAKHNGYVKSFSTWHERNFKYEDNQLNIHDILSQNINGESHIHFAHGIKPIVKDDLIEFNELPYSIKVINADSITIEEYFQANGYNQYLKNYKVIIGFRKESILIYEF